MKKIMMGVCVLAMMIGLSACSGAFWGGTGTGTLATGAGYEVNAKVKLNQLKKDLAAGKIDQKEYNIREDQIKKMSLLN